LDKLQSVIRLARESTTCFIIGTVSHGIYPLDARCHSWRLVVHPVSKLFITGHTEWCRSLSIV